MLKKFNSKIAYILIMVQMRIESTPNNINNSFGEIINKFQDCNINEKKKTKTKIKKKQEKTKTNKKHKDSWKKKIKTKPSKTTRNRFYLIKTV